MFLRIIKEKLWVQIFVIYTRYILGGAFIFASPRKILGFRFTSSSGEVYEINTAWHLFETFYQSGLYWSFLGIVQFFAGFLLLTQRFSKLGALIYFAIILNIFVITLSYSTFGFTRVITGLMLLANLMLLLWEWNELKILFNKTQTINNKKNITKNPIWELIGLVLFSYIFIYRFVYINYATISDILIVGVGSFLICLIGLFIGLKKIKY